MSLAQEVALIRRIPILNQLDSAAQKMICFASERVFYAAGDTVFRQGERADAAYVIIEGAVEIVIATAGGPLHINQVAQHGIFGEIGLCGDLPRSATALAAAPLDLLRIPREVFNKVIHGSPEAARCLTTVLAERLTRITEQLSEAAVCQSG
jgi:CRP-like cAMP-binding protein